MPPKIGVHRFIRAVLNYTTTYLQNGQYAASLSANASGNIGQRPFSNRAGILKLLLVCSSSFYVGALIAHKGASYLEENEIFVPTDEDDDD
uniref:Essential MCU regulator, mitochondrial n=1 Tax=Caenorhabditis japonica TaxID=281687 RepID=A0A8R1II69_CAEJA